MRPPPIMIERNTGSAARSACADRKGEPLSGWGTANQERLKMIYTFWEGKMPEYIRLCLNTWRFPYMILNYSNLSQYTEMDIKRAKRFSLPQIADCVRVHMLRDNGGYWLDADTIMISDKLPDATILGDPESRINTIGFLHAEAHSEMFEEWARFQDAIIKGVNVPHYWAAVGNEFTDPYLKKHKEIEIGQIDDYWAETYMIKSNLPRYNKYLRFYFAEHYQLSDIRKTDMLMLHNSWTPEWYKELSRAEVLSMSCTLSNILRDLTT